jgi:pyrroloquinoline quinone (PQQ) biosynthesis protein C
MALFQANMETDHTALESKFLKHAAMEVGHDKLVLDDLRALGVDPDKVRQSRPLPTTEALTGFIVFQIEYRNPYAYLGYLYHLEALPTSIGEAAGKTLNKIGIPLGAQSFLKEHTEVDTVHMKWNQEYLEGFLRNEQDFEAVLYGLKGTCELHGLMFDSIMENYS